MGSFYLRRSVASLLMLSALTLEVRAEDLTIMISGGTFADAQIEAFVKPFEQESGITVKAIKSEMPAAKFKLAVESNSVDFDLCLKSEADGIMLERLGYVEPIDYSTFKPEELDGISEALRPSWGVGNITSSFVLASNTDTMKAAPTNWAEFWDLKKFPGKRTLQAFIGVQGPLEEALLADGVEPDKLYPLDVDRAFHKLDEIKPYIRKWWTSGNDALQLFNTGAADAGMNFDGRVYVLQAEKRPVTLTFNQAKYYAVYWTIPKGAPNKEAAQKFVEFATRAKQQAAMSEISGYAPANVNAMQFLPEEKAKKLVTYPANMKTAYKLNGDWYATVGDDGKTNAERVQERWNIWLTQ